MVNCLLYSVFFEVISLNVPNKHLSLQHFLSEPAERWSRELLSMDRNHIRRVVGAIIGHCGLNKHLTRMSILGNLECFCGLDEEKTCICDCPKTSQLRLRTLGSYERFS